jgi:hypothetical protein
MNIEGLNLNLRTLHEPKSDEDLIFLLEEACAQFERIHALMIKIIESGRVAEAA